MGSRWMVIGGDGWHAMVVVGREGEGAAEGYWDYFCLFVWLAVDECRSGRNGKGKTKGSGDHAL